MLQKKTSILIAACIFIFALSLNAAQVTITISRVSDDLPKHYKELKPFIDYLAAQLQTMGIKKGDILLARNNQELIQFVKDGKVDIVTETPFPAMVLMEKAGMKILLRRWKKGVPNYKSVIFTRKDSKINSLEDLKGKVIAFEDPGSTTGYFLPKVEIIKKGLQLVELKNYKEKPPLDKIGYCFAQSEVNIGHWVHKGFVEAGVLNDLEYQSPEEVPANFISDFKIIYETEEVPRNLILVRADMEPKLQEKIKEIILNMGLTDEGRKIMWGMLKTSQFDELPEKALEEMAKRFKEKYELLKAEIEKLP
ncbi:MAG: phosphate/phosphite/phosphonate ABC transporter substrate-binding protein [Candidatus Omnitrophota bacterium]|nr:phosphate/phosphite/phosphonate ABC transporter substrate-binding protein [Candidatus Omnitrophota bacterium]